ncbi:MAG TPA: S8 family serine peptidase [Blastocatellia bacterium]|nr:S8 family serine peptidase [Blastocatellia bacterium]
MRIRLIIYCLLIAILPLSSPLPSTRAVQSGEFEDLQGYLDPAPLGMDVRYAWTLPGGTGRNVRIVDIEVNWNLHHNDLSAAITNAFLVDEGVDPQPDVNVNHGTAVLGELVAAPDGVGVTGIAYDAQLGLISPLKEGVLPRVAEAVARATKRLGPGDVILIEAQSLHGPRFDPQTGRGLVPIEWDLDVFNAIKAATAKGIVVIEPAGNGFEDLDHPAYNGKFNRNVRDSGAIIVGSGLPEGEAYGRGPDRTRAEESNYGSRVDLQGWGRSITTCGYGDLRRGQGEDNWYTSEFGGTSGAAAMVAGAAAVLQSILIERGQPPLTPIQLRRLLAATGTPQTGDTGQNIGPRPNLRAAIEMLDRPPQDSDPVILNIKYKSSSGKLIVDGENFLDDISVIEINGTAIPRMKYPANYVLPGGLMTRVTSKGDISAMLPRGVAVSITVYNPSSGRRSTPVMFTRQ